MSLASHALGAHDPRVRYLSAYDPRARHLTGLRGVDIRTLGMRGLGCGRCVSALGQDINDPDIVGMPTIPTSSSISTPDIVGMPTGVAPPVAPVAATGSGSSVAPDIVGLPTFGGTGLVMPTASTAASVAQQLAPNVVGMPGVAPVASAPGTFMGIPTQYLMYGVLGIMALSVLGGRKKGRR